MSTIHVDETTGSDETGTGTPEQPYQSLAFALFAHPDAKVLARKDAGAAYEEPTQSALKKAKKGAEDGAEAAPPPRSLGKPGKKGGKVKPAGRYAGKSMQRVRTELKTVDQIRKNRELVAKRKAKNARPTHKGRGKR